jgi:large subunit ribosomal protein L18
MRLCDFEVGPERPLFLIAGPCVIESEGLVLDGKGKVAKAKAAGKLLAAKAKAAGITKVVFDRGGYRYHGRVQAVADGAREGGLEF